MQNIKINLVEDQFQKFTEYTEREPIIKPRLAERLNSTEPFQRREYKYIKTRVGPQDGYKVFFEDQLIGRVIKDWEKCWGGVCWTIRREGEPKVTFETRRSASEYLYHLSEEA